MTKSKIFIIIVICVITLIIFLLDNKYEGFKNKGFRNDAKESSTLILLKDPSNNPKKCKIKLLEKGIKLSGPNCCIEIDEKNDHCNSKLITCSTGILGAFHYKPKKATNFLKDMENKKKKIKKSFRDKIDKKTLNTVLELSNFNDKNTFKKEITHKFKRLTMKKALELVDKYSKTLAIQNCVSN
jgi:hypothetical protein